MGRETVLHDDTWTWYRVVMADSLPGLTQAFILSQNRLAWRHPRFGEARLWCLGPMILGQFVPRISGGFLFQDARDAAAFKLTWG